MGSTPVFGHIVQVYRARLAAVDDWDHVGKLIASPDPVPAIMDHLDVPEIAARAVVAMVDRPLPARDELETQLRVIEQIRDDLMR